MFQPIYRSFKKVGNSDHISACDSKGFSDESIRSPATTDDSFAPSLNQIVFPIRIKFDGQCLKQDKATFKHKTIANIHIEYDVNLWSFKQSADFTLGNSLFGAVRLTKMLILANINIQDMVLDLIEDEAFSYLMVAVLVKT